MIHTYVKHQHKPWITLLQVPSPPFYMLRISRTSADSCTNYFGFRLKPEIHPRGYARNAWEGNCIMKFRERGVLELVSRCVTVRETKKVMTTQANVLCWWNALTLTRIQFLLKDTSAGEDATDSRVWSVSARGQLLWSLCHSAASHCAARTICGLCCLHFPSRNRQRVRVNSLRCNCFLVQAPAQPGKFLVNVNNPAPQFLICFYWTGQGQWCILQTIWSENLAQLNLLHF